MLVISLALGGCAHSDLAYYWQGFRGQLALLQASRPVSEWLAQDDLADATRQRLLAAQHIRAFASRELALPDNSSYHRYAELARPYPVWNVVAAPPDSLQLHTWCFPIAGCVGYRGYFAEEQARAEALRLANQGLEVDVYGVPAYSTLGYLNWLGGDALLSSFIHWPQADLAGLLFHELAHQVVYVADDTAFNESFATAVERLATPQWLASQGDPALLSRWQAGQQRRQAWQALTRQTRARLQAIYQPAKGGPHQPLPLLAQKARAMADFRASYQALRQDWQQADAALGLSAAQQQAYQASQARLDQWVQRANNASMGALGAYDEWVPAFAALWQTLHTAAPGAAPVGTAAHWQRFYAQVRLWAQLPGDERQSMLCRHMPADSPLPPACTPGHSPTAAF